jgi:hypothetical protein
MTDKLSREELQHLASSGNGWAQQEMIRRFGVAHDAIIKSVDDNETLYEVYQAAPTVATLNLASVQKEEERDSHGRWAAGGSEMHTNARDQVHEAGLNASTKINQGNVSRLLDQVGNYGRGFGYHGERRNNEGLAERLDPIVGKHAEDNNWNMRQLHEWADSKNGRYFGESGGDTRYLEAGSLGEPSKKSFEPSLFKVDLRNKSRMNIDPELKKHLERAVLRGGDEGTRASAVLLKYGDDQPRDSNGRFASGGGSGESATNAAQKASERAEAASAKADKSGSFKDQQAAARAHADATDAHVTASNAHYAAGDENYAAHHAAQAEGHAELAGEYEQDSAIDNGIADHAYDSITNLPDVEPDLYAI